MSTNTIHIIILYLYIIILALLFPASSGWSYNYQADSSGGSTSTNIAIGTSNPIVKVKPAQDGSGYLVLSSNQIWKLNTTFGPVTPWGTSTTIYRTLLNGGIDFFVTNGGSVVILETVNTVVRLTSNGEFDENFGVSGRVTIPYSGFTMTAQTILVDNSDRTYVFGTKSVGTGFHFHAYRLDTSGLDTTYTNNGFWEWTDDLGGTNTGMWAGDTTDDGNLIVCGTLNVAPAQPKLVLFKFTPRGLVRSQYVSSTSPTKCLVRVSQDNTFAMTATVGASYCEFIKWDLLAMNYLNIWTPNTPYTFSVNLAMELELDGSILLSFRLGNVNYGQVLRLPPTGLPLSLIVSYASIYPIALFSLPATSTTSNRYALFADNNIVYYFGNVYACARPLVSATQVGYMPTSSDVTLSPVDTGLVTTLNMRELIPSRQPVTLIYRNPDNWADVCPLVPTITETINAGTCVLKFTTTHTDWYKHCFTIATAPTTNVYSSLLEMSWYENTTSLLGVVVPRAVQASFSITLSLPAIVTTPALFDFANTNWITDGVIGDVTFVRETNNVVDFHIKLVLFTKPIIFITQLYNQQFNMTVLNVTQNSKFNQHTFEWVVRGVCSVTGVYTFNAVFGCVDGSVTCADLKVGQFSVTMNTNSVCAVVSATPYTATGYVNLMNNRAIPKTKFEEADVMLNVKTWAVITPLGAPSQQSLTILLIKINNKTLPTNAYTIDATDPVVPIVSLPFSLIRTYLIIGRNNLQLTLLIRFTNYGLPLKRDVLMTQADGDILRSVVDSNFDMIDSTTNGTTPTPSGTTPTTGGHSGMMNLLCCWVVGVLIFSFC